MNTQMEISKREWENFVKGGQFNQKNVREVIYQSWQRCKENNVDPFGGRGEKQDEKLLDSIRKTNKDLIKIARPFMEELAKVVRNSNFVVVLTDSSGMIVEIAGDEEIIDRAIKLRFSPGSYWSEEKVGTNAIGTAIKIDKPLQVIGAEHYCQKHHPWTCSAATIHNQNGDLIGILNMSGDSEYAHPHTLGMVVAAAKSIENQIFLIEKNRELKKADNFSKAIFNSMSEGLISINNHGKVILINQAGSRMLGVNRKKVFGIDIKEILGEQKPIEKMLADHKVFNDEELSIP
ncbi:MAG: GAF domain-containing protein [Halanaerobiales bacterium]|nr:GAF domain-containing protein [Halanaerobiales bacterium]